MSSFSYQDLWFQGQFSRVEDWGSGVKRLVLSRPEVRNAFHAAMIQELNRVLLDLTTLPIEELRVLLLSGDGKVFCAGADLTYMQSQMSAGLNENREDARQLAHLFHQLAAFPVPVIAATHGSAIGGGLGLAACADLVIAEKRCRFGTSEVRLGLLPAIISPYIIRRIGLATASDLMLTGRMMTAKEAQQIGLVQRIVDLSAGESTATVIQGVVAELLHTAPQASRQLKQLIKQIAPLPSDATCATTIEFITHARVSAEGQTGMTSFLTRSTPSWVPTWCTTQRAGAEPAGRQLES